MDHLELYALRDLIALSEKGGEKLVKRLETTLAHYDKHITQQCLVRICRQRHPIFVDKRRVFVFHSCIGTTQHNGFSAISAYISNRFAPVLVVTGVRAALPGARSYVRGLHQS